MEKRKGWVIFGTFTIWRKWDGRKEITQFFWIDSDSFLCRNSSKPAIRLPSPDTVPIDRRRAFDLFGRRQPVRVIISD
ncbi:hypothetical protein CDAR_242371 [Caerostris darwini]|uniref:Uncharacterized protein n=1 Tax=Caerostris darwini TaxID=1538125 RepID=A0AAV4RVD1_9ARAC|nr:hypothetical protein CDAR_242371 [Caerostris darwini]